MYQKPSTLWSFTTLPSVENTNHVSNTLMNCCIKPAAGTYCTYIEHNTCYSRQSIYHIVIGPRARISPKYDQKAKPPDVCSV